MSGIIHDESARLYVLHVETLKFVHGLDFTSCQCHWYVGSAHNASALLPVAPPGQKYLLDFCTFVVADVEADVEVKLTVATVEGEHFAVYFGQLTGLARDQQFVRRDLELKNVQGTVATAAVFCALQQRWTVGHGACAREPGDAIVVGPEDTQASYVLQHIFPEAEAAKVEPSGEPYPGGLNPGAAKAEKDKVSKDQGVKEVRRASKVKRRSIRKRSSAPEGEHHEKMKILDRIDSSAPSAENAMEDQHPCPSCCGLTGSPSGSPGDSNGTSPTRAESETCDAPEEPKALEVEDDSLASAPRGEQSPSQAPVAPATAGSTLNSTAGSEKLAPEVLGPVASTSPFEKADTPRPGATWRSALAQRCRESEATRQTSNGSIGEPLAPSEVGSTTCSAPSEKTAPSETAPVRSDAAAPRLEAPSDSEPELPLPSQQELAEEINAQPKVQRGPHHGLWCRAQRAYAEDCAKQCRRPQDGCNEDEGDALWLHSRSATKQQKIPQATPPSTDSGVTPGRSAPLEWEVDQRGRWFRVMATALSIRRRPEVDAPLAGELPFGEVFQAVSSTGEDGFKFLELSRGRGWVFSDARVQPVLVIDDPGVTEMVKAERRPEQAPVEAEAEPEPSCQSPRISEFKAKKPLRPFAEQLKPLRGRSRGHERLGQRQSQTAKETPHAAPVSKPVTSDVPSPTGSECATGERRPPGMARASTGSPIRATRRAWSMEQRGETRELKIDASGPLQAWPGQPVRANHSLASQCFTPTSQSFGAEVDRGSRPELWTPWKPGRAWRRARSAEAQNFRIWDFRVAKENLEERQRIQAALLKVALRVHPDDGRSTSMPARCRNSLKRLHLFDETMVDGHWNNAAKRPISRRSSRAHDLCDVLPGRLGATRERRPGAVLSRHSGAGGRGRPAELAEDDRVVCPRYGLADILLRV